MRHRLATYRLGSADGVEIDLSAGDLLQGDRIEHMLNGQDAGSESLHCIVRLNGHGLLIDDRALVVLTIDEVDRHATDRVTCG